MAGGDPPAWPRTQVVVRSARSGWTTTTTARRTTPGAAVSRAAGSGARAELPVVIHSRDAHADTVRVLRDAARGQPGIMHSFSGDWAYAEACLEVGFSALLQRAGDVPKATELHEVARPRAARPHPDRDRQPIPCAASAARQAQRPAEMCGWSPSGWRRCARSICPGLRGRCGIMRRRCLVSIRCFDAITICKESIDGDDPGNL